MNDMTATVLFWSALGVSYQCEWPHLRTTAQKLLGWVFGIPSAVFLATISCGFLANLLATVPLYFVEFHFRFRLEQRAPPLVQRLMATANLNLPTRFGFGLLSSEFGLGFLASDTPQSSAALAGQTDGLALLFTAAADVPLTCGLSWIASNTPLSWAAKHNHTETVAALLKAGADPNAPSSLGLGLLLSVTPLGVAARDGRTETVVALLKEGADPNAPFTLGLGLLLSRTPLSWAAENCHTETVAALLKAGADPKGLGHGVGSVGRCLRRHEARRRPTARSLVRAAAMAAAAAAWRLASHV